jgi:hypothetical protein
LSKEGTRRDEELELLRQQVEGQQADRRSHERARLTVPQGVAGNRRGGGIEYTFGVKNVGEAIASEITVELVDSGRVKIGTPAEIVTTRAFG